VLAMKNILVLVLISLFIAVSLDPAVRWLTRATCAVASPWRSSSASPSAWSSR
jgi:predicted PurR-regulated permease PerM